MPLYDRCSRPTARELKALPVLCVGQADNLHYEDDVSDEDVRFWLSRCGVADGMPYENTVTIELRTEDEGWHTYVTYDGGPVEDDE